MRLAYILAFFTVIWPSVAFAGSIHHVAPPASQLSGNPDGSLDRPWGSIADLFRRGNIRGGDTVLLLDGHHGELRLNNAAFSEPVTIQSLTGKRAHFGRIHIRGNSKNIVLKNLAVWPISTNANNAPAVLATPSTSDITADGLDVSGGREAAKYLSWSIADWKKHHFIGIHLRGRRGIVRNSTVRAVWHGIMVEGKNSVIENNKVNGFSGDGLRALGDWTLVRGNLVTNCFKVDGNHDDGFQSWSPRKKPGAAITGLLIEANTIIEWTEAPGHPLRCQLQGISMFDGFYDSLVVQNNLVSISAYHGITVLGGRNVQIFNNTVVSSSGLPGKAPWIMVQAHKNKSRSRDVLVANNVAMRVRVKNDTRNNIVSRDNSAIRNPFLAFRNIKLRDYRPNPTSGFVDTANVLYAPNVDILGRPRPYGAGPDRGAFELDE